MAAYGPAIVVALVILVALSVLFAMGRSNSEKTAASPVAAPTVDPQLDIDQRFAEARKRTGGDWNKATAEEKGYLDQISRGHGRELLKMKPK